MKGLGGESEYEKNDNENVYIYIYNDNDYLAVLVTSQRSLAG